MKAAVGFPQTISNALDTVRGAAARVLATLKGSAILDELVPYLADAEPLLRQGVTVGLLRGGGIAGILAAGQQLLYARDVFGEMALLDPEPRTASITAVADTLLLRLDQAPFYELMDEHHQIARGIIRMLTRNLCARARSRRGAPPHRSACRAGRFHYSARHAAGSLAYWLSQI
jgi:CRP-like cAMP-binding protein